jgi:hypothetical protein
MLLLALSSLALIPARGIILPTPTFTPGTVTPTLTLQAVTLTPKKTKPTPIPLVTQAGNSDRIVLIGILIVGIVVVPILLKRKEWRGNS